MRFKGRDIAGAGPVRLARLGLARSFQLVQIFPELTVLETLQAAVVSRLGRGRRLLGSLAARRRGAAGRRARGGALRARRASSTPRAAHLPQGDKKLLDVASAFALRPEAILLDEPTSGVSHRATRPR